jgi:hypothetical protein
MGGIRGGIERMQKRGLEMLEMDMHMQTKVQTFSADYS